MTHDTKQTTGAELLAARPSAAQAVIVAEWHQDTSGSMPDYAAHETTRVVVLAWSRHQRDLFPELRKAADLFEATAHLGMGKGDFRVRVVLANDYVTGETAYWRGTQSPWHRDVLDGEAAKVFATRDAAEAWMAQAPALREMAQAANAANIARFTYQIVESRIEHREGHGYYLKRGHTHETGWAVQKHGLSWLERYGDNTIETIITLLRDHATSAASITSEAAIRPGLAEAAADKRKGRDSNAPSPDLAAERVPTETTVVSVGPVTRIYRVLCTSPLHHGTV
jgi:hypothetical protein